MSKYFIALIVGCLLGAVGQIMLKIGATGVTRLTAFGNSRVFLGLLAYAISTVLWVFALSRIPLNIVYAFTALTFCLVYFFSVFFLGESISLRGWVGLILIIVGFLVIASSASQPP